MRPVHQLVHTLTFGDAISGEVLALQRSFREFGAESDIFAINIDPRFKGLARDYRELQSDYSGEAILHYSLGSPLNALYRGLRHATRSIIHHNLTPAHWFKAINPRIAQHIEMGERELPDLCAISDRLIADSRFNAAEMPAQGRTVEVLNLPIDTERWKIAANSGIEALLRSDPVLHIVHVGRLAPNKCIEDIVKTFYFLRTVQKIPARLWLVGHDIDTELYSFSLKRLVRELDLMDAVNFVGRMADSEVKAVYLNAHAYLCMSEHEGFCCPIIEAMHFGLPVIAYNSSALPDTVSAGGILVNHKRHAELAFLLAKVCRDQALRSQIIENGRRRAAELSIDRFAAKVRAIFDQGANREHLRAGGSGG
ncbi:MAG: glycosyltransferase [Oligoflexia bacterium]|nr:glycosyltransferase [Oligoflexia bacterium]